MGVDPKATSYFTSRHYCYTQFKPCLGSRHIDQTFKISSYVCLNISRVHSSWLKRIRKTVNGKWEALTGTAVCPSTKTRRKLHRVNLPRQLILHSPVLTVSRGNIITRTLATTITVSCGERRQRQPHSLTDTPHLTWRAMMDVAAPPNPWSIEKRWHYEKGTNQMPPTVWSSIIFQGGLQ